MQNIIQRRFLALGDSYTVGEGIFAEESWPFLLSQRLTSSGCPCAPPERIAQTGWTSGELLAAVREQRPVGPYDIVTLLIGVNDQYRGLPVPEMVANVQELLDAAILLAGGQPSRVFVISIPDWGSSPFGQTREPATIHDEVVSFSNAIASEAASRQLTWIDITAISRLASLSPAFNASDNLHPSGAMHHLWLELIAPPILERLRNASSSEST